MNCWNILDLPFDADERTLKRRYAQLLKIHRPDEDLEAFQRLREAYEVALAFVRSRLEEEEVVEMPASTAVPADTAQTSVSPQQGAQQEIQESLRNPTPEQLDASLAAAQARGLQTIFERCLLERCLWNDEQGHVAAGWAMGRLAWLTPWQSAELPSGQMERLFGQRLDVELKALYALLQAAQEDEFIRRVNTLAKEDWLQPFERREQFDLRLVEVLLHAPQWSSKLFDRLCSAFGWSRDHGKLPCDVECWGRLMHRSEEMWLKGALAAHLDRSWPGTPEQNAAWLLLKPLAGSERRHLADGFMQQDWLACFHLESLLARHPSLVDSFSPQGVVDWRSWLPSEAWSGVPRYLVILFSLLFVVCAGWKEGFAEMTPGRYFAALGLGGLMSAVVVSFFSKLHEGWHGLCCRFAAFDVRISESLLPASWVRQGAGLLLLRHGVPSVCVGIGAWLVSSRSGSPEPLVGVASVVLALAFANQACRGWTPGQTWQSLIDWLRRKLGPLSVAMILGFVSAPLGTYVIKKLPALFPIQSFDCSEQAIPLAEMREQCKALKAKP
jgi:hypothetical protein